MGIRPCLGWGGGQCRSSGMSRARRVGDRAGRRRRVRFGCGAVAVFIGITATQALPRGVILRAAQRAGIRIPVDTALIALHAIHGNNPARADGCDRRTAWRNDRGQSPDHNRHQQYGQDKRQARMTEPASEGAHGCHRQRSQRQNEDRQKHGQWILIQHDAITKVQPAQSGQDERADKQKNGSQSGSHQGSSLNVAMNENAHHEQELGSTIHQPAKISCCAAGPAPLSSRQPPRRLHDCPARSLLADALPAWQRLCPSLHLRCTSVLEQ